MGDPGLQNRASRGALLLGGKTFLAYLIGIARLAILARLLSPEDFGLYGLAIVLYRGLKTFTEVGTRRYLIQKPDLEPALVRSAWGLDLLRALIVALAMWAAGVPYARIIQAPALIQILMIVGIAAAVRGLTNPGKTLSERDVHFGRIVATDLIQSVLGAAVIIALALQLRSATALAWGLVVESSLGVVLSFLFFPAVGAPRFHARDWRELFTVGRHFFVISVGTFITTQVDNLAAGTLLSVASAGLYIVAYRLASLPLEFFFRVSNRVAVPVLSRLHSNSRSLTERFRELVELQYAALMPMVVFLVAFPDIVILVLYGDQWQAAIPVLRALGVLMLARGSAHIAGPFLLATGRFREIARAKVSELAVFLAGTIAGALYWGLSGLALGAGVGYVVGALALVRYVRRSGEPGVNWVRVNLVSLASTLPALGLTALCRASLETSPWLELSILATVFGTVYLGTLWLARRALAERALGLIRAAAA